MRTAGVLIFFQSMMITPGNLKCVPCVFRPNEKTTAELLSELDGSQLEDLLKLYKEDFDIHGYDPYKYSMS